MYIKVCTQVCIPCIWFIFYVFYSNKIFKLCNYYYKTHKNKPNARYAYHAYLCMGPNFKIFYRSQKFNLRYACMHY
ncbi:hypothetical protein CHBEV_327 [Choristoneura biennis entomopoxvirus]|uniref:Uncharacterized protein n=1 Tax=Choristoneura biennis entomopoxvirus TaxID=10288 RepID=A0A916KPX9_CBEPV|nr:hypothetical protein CHBEV_008 [Choristoneura biennis entomopoxvirus]YP_008004397.1 hypothetical protein CHBEV_327 [Choristoneura biennis entomopoxvirus]CCU55576.1 hypothetical protein CHBEV_008 [Choristoneura biennis entomopoxvirus]CCU55895.1 hypothetical protein CHBEV_327 [Choristoneura biennis entomopoxvirus]